MMAQTRRAAVRQRNVWIGGRNDRTSFQVNVKDGRNKGLGRRWYHLPQCERLGTERKSRKEQV